jgi:hypothetical protein
MKTSCIVLLFWFIYSSSATSQELPKLDPALNSELTGYIKTHYQSPEDYILSKFKDHDVVFLGENHYIKHDSKLVQSLIPIVYKAGVFYLGFEFARRVDQPLIDSLLNGQTYDEQLARSITFRQFVHWAFQEYIDIYKSAWQLNHSLPAGSRKFQILALNNSPDWSLVKSQIDREKGDVMLKVWHGEDEGDWAKVILDSVIAKGEKALVYSGAHHAFTEYRQPIAFDHKFIRFGDVRLGNFVFNKIEKRAITVFLHAPWVSADGYDKPYVYSADGYIDAVIEQLDPKYQRVGFDTKGTPFGKLSGETSLYKYGYKEFTLETIYDGYICQGPLSTYEGVTTIRDFVNEANVEQARAQSPDPEFRHASVEDFYKAALDDANVPQRLPKHK